MNICDRGEHRKRCDRVNYNHYLILTLEKMGWEINQLKLAIAELEIALFKNNGPISYLDKLRASTNKKTSKTKRILNNSQNKIEMRQGAPRTLLEESF